MTRKRAASAFQNPYISVSHQQQNQCSPKPAAQSQQIEVEAIEGLLDLCNGLKRAINTSGHAWKSYVRECHKLAASSPSPDAQTPEQLFGLEVQASIAYGAIGTASTDLKNAITTILTTAKMPQQHDQHAGQPVQWQSTKTAPLPSKHASQPILPQNPGNLDSRQTAINGQAKQTPTIPDGTAPGVTQEKSPYRSSPAEERQCSLDRMNHSQSSCSFDKGDMNGSSAMQTAELAIAGEKMERIELLLHQLPSETSLLLPPMEEPVDTSGQQPHPTIRVLTQSSTDITGSFQSASPIPCDRHRPHESHNSPSNPGTPESTIIVDSSIHSNAVQDPGANDLGLQDQSIHNGVDTDRMNSNKKRGFQSGQAGNKDAGNKKKKLK